MKHDKDITTQVSAQLEVRVHLPDPVQCDGCHHMGGDCSRLEFSQMPRLSVHRDGVAFVDCVQFDDARRSDEQADA